MTPWWARVFIKYDNIKTLKTATNSNITDTSFAVRRAFVVTLSGGSGQITAGTNESFPSSASDSDYLIAIDDINIKDINDLKKYIVKKYPDLIKHIEQDVLRIAVNHEYIVENISLNANDEIAIFPPVSGG